MPGRPRGEEPALAPPNSVKIRWFQTTWPFLHTISEGSRRLWKALEGCGSVFYFKIPASSKGNTNTRAPGQESRYARQTKKQDAMRNKLSPPCSPFLIPKYCQTSLRFHPPRLFSLSIPFKPFQRLKPFAQHTSPLRGGIWKN